MEGVSTALTGAMTTLQGQVLGAMAIIVPIALVLFGAVYLIRWGKKGFKAAAN